MTLPIKRLVALIAMVSVLACAACGFNSDDAGETRVGPTTRTLTVIIYLDLESDATLDWEDEGKGSPNEARFEFAQDESITTWWDSEEPMQLTTNETENVFWAIATSDQENVVAHIFAGDSPATQVSVLLAWASKAAIGKNLSLVVRNQARFCGPQGL